jgi:hypothetical protein
VREQLEREFAAREQAAREAAQRERLLREEVELELAARDRAARELAAQLAREQHEAERQLKEALARERQAHAEALAQARAAREAAERELAMREQAAHALADRERLAREEVERQLAAREQADRGRLVREMEAQALALTEAVRAAQQFSPAPAESATRTRLRLTRPRPRRAAESSRGGERVRDEWGLYDPAACGIEALFARLDGTHDTSPTRGDAPNPAGRLLAAEPHASPETHARARRERPAPLVMWARRDGHDAQPVVAAQPPDDPLRTIVAGLRLPAAVASVTAPNGCRIGRVRATRRSAAARPARTGQLIIVSRRLLDAVRPRRARTAAPVDPLTAALEHAARPGIHST